MIHLDTHVVIWLHDGGSKTGRLKRPPYQFKNNPRFISPIVILELGLMFEKKRIRIPPSTIVAIVADQFSVQVSKTPFEDLVRHSMDLIWTREPIDRLIVAAAYADNAKLFTFDRHILANCPIAFDS
ncbi:MAG: PIN domain-containing protein [Deltaproteobacteria bacterium]|nr:PIN domain-containing protein [bacterium]MCB9476862.1 PIN domain-containing protein [Deltaproteobacteria bacterium]MCB9489541.1 PIN domain-containing protein [Deltaproteobacteria bacterium]